MSGIPSKNPINLIINIEAMITTNPIMPVVIFFLALSSDCLSPPDVTMPIAPVMNEKINQMIPMIVIRPIAEDMNVLKISIPFPGAAKRPLPFWAPVKPPFGANSIAK